MKKNNPFKGLGVALVTPFCHDGSVDFDSLRKLVEYQIASGIDFLCVLGTTAETPCLTDEERARVKDCVVEVAAGRVPILLGYGSNCTAGLVDSLTRGLVNLDGIDGLLVVTPYYNKPTQEGLYQHFMAVAKAAGEMPIVLYNVPGRCGVNMTAETTLRLASEAPNVVAIKEASGNLEQIQTIIDNAPEGFDLLSGDDGITNKLIGMGAAGVISVVANAVCEKFARMVHASIQGDKAVANTIDDALGGLYKLAFVDGNPAGIKALLAAKGVMQNNLRLPLVPASAETCEAIKEFASIN